MEIIFCCTVISDREELKVKVECNVIITLQVVMLMLITALIVSYWCHTYTVSVFTAFSPNRIGEYDTNYRIYQTVLFMGQIGRELRWGIHYGKSYVGYTIGYLPN